MTALRTNTGNHWEQFMPSEERKLKLTMKPKPFDLERTKNWILEKVSYSSICDEP